MKNNQRKFLKINEFVPNPTLLKEFMEKTESPEPPEQSEIEKLKQLEESTKQAYNNYIKECESHPDLPKNNPTLMILYDTFTTSQEELDKIRKSISQKQQLFDFYHYIQILRKYKLEGLLQSFFNALNNGLPSITFFLLKFDEIAKIITDSDDYLFFRKFDIIPLLVDKKPVQLDFPIYIPRYNLLHIGNICHFNSCINMLSSLTGLINDLSGLKQKKLLNPNADYIYQYILNSHSFIDLNPGLLIKIIEALNISLNKMYDANETMKKILRQLYASGVSLQTLFYWDSTDEFYKKEELTHQLSTKLSELKPMYYLCNNHDFNSVYNIDSHMIELQSFDITDEKGDTLVSYTLSSFLIFNSNHYTCAFVKESDRPLKEEIQINHQALKPSNDLTLNSTNETNNETSNETNSETSSETSSESSDDVKKIPRFEYDIEIKNDLSSRYKTYVSSIDSSFRRGNQHSLCCYVRSDLVNH